MGQAGAEKGNRAKQLDHFRILVLQHLPINWYVS